MKENEDEELKGVNSVLDKMKFHAGDGERSEAVKEAWSVCDLIPKLLDAEDNELQHLCQAFVILENTRKGMEDAVKYIKTQTAELTREIEQRFSSSEIQNVNIRGRTVYLNRDLRTGYNKDAVYIRKDEDGKPIETFNGKEAMVQALKDFPLTSHLVVESYNNNSLGGVVRNDFPRDADDMPDIPEELEGILKVSEVFKVKSRKA